MVGRVGWVLWMVAACQDKAPDSGHSGTVDSTPIDSTPNDSADARFAALAEAVERERLAMEAPGAAVAVFDAEGLVWAQGFGERHPSQDLGPVQPTTLFKAGSIGKSMTTVALLQLVQEGALDLDDPVTAVVPELDFTLDASWAPSTTARLLLTHTAGYYDYFDLSGGDDSKLEEVMLGFYAQNCWLLAPPGSFWNYSNPHFSLSGLLVERLRGVWYREAMEQQVFEPLGMTRATFSNTEVEADGDFAYGRSSWNSTLPKAVGPDAYDSAFLRPAGLEWVSAVELAAFARFLMVGDPAVLDDTLREAMQAPQVDMQLGGGLYSYGYGLMVNPGFFLGDDWIPAPMVHHDGAIMGYSAQMAYLPEQGWGVVMLASTDGAYFSEALVQALGLAPGLPEPEEAPDLSPDPALYADLAGDWMDPWNTGPMQVVVEGESITLALPLLDEVGYPYEPELVPYTPDNYILGIGGTYALLTLIRDELGQPEYLRARFAVWEVAEEGARFAPQNPPDPARLDALLRCDGDLLRCSMGVGIPGLSP